MRPKSLMLFALALGCGLIAAIGINQVMANRGSAPPQLGETTPIFVALNEVELGEPLTPAVVKLEPWPKDKVPQGAFSKLEEIEGRRARTKLFVGEPILENKLLSKDASLQGASGFIPKGMRVVAVKVDAVSGSSGLLLPGDRVDVLVQIQANPSRGIAETSARTILQDVKVFAVNETFRREHKDKDDQAITAKTVSLLVKPEAAELITLASELGNIRLVMRSTEDDTISSTSGAGVRHLFGETDNDSTRGGESLMADGNLDRDKFLDMLNGSKTPPPAAPTVAPPPAQVNVPKPWKMLLLIGSNAQQVVFNGDGEGIHAAPWGEGNSLHEPEPAAGLADGDSTGGETLGDDAPAGDNPPSDENSPGEPPAEPAPAHSDDDLSLPPDDVPAQDNEAN